MEDQEQDEKHEENVRYVPDPVDSYKHIGIVDFTNAFSNQEVS
jgi:hypothetical protein